MPAASDVRSRSVGGHDEYGYSIELASELRERHGPGITDILKTAIAKVAGVASSCDKV
jgi:hypothetical protein